MDFPRAWQIVGGHGLLCDCPVLTGHPEYHESTTTDGKPWPTETEMRQA